MPFIISLIVHNSCLIFAANLLSSALCYAYGVAYWTV